MIPALLLGLFGFLCGSVPIGVMVARAFNVKNLQRLGSGNVGATNVARVAGIWPGLITLFLDVLKGALPVVLARQTTVQAWMSSFHPSFGGVLLSGGEVTETVIWWIGFAVVAGHCYSPWLKFKGGKGVATGLGVSLVLFPVGAIAGVVAFAGTFYATRIASLSSLTALAVVTGSYVVIQPAGQPLGAHSWFGALMIATIVFRHESNIDALLEGRERAFE